MTKPCGSCQLKPELSEGQAALGLNFKFACPFSSGIVRDRWRAVGLPLLARWRPLGQTPECPLTVAKLTLIR